MSMGRLGCLGVFSAIVLILSVQCAAAFDGDRKGFVLGCGVGVGALDPSGGNWPGIQTNVKIGWGLNERFLILYSGYTFVSASSAQAIALLRPTLAASYYFRPAAPSLYLIGGCGASVDLTVIEGGFDLGPHFLAGVGLEAFRHLSVELLAKTYYTESYAHGVAEGWIMDFSLTLNVLGF